MHQRLLCPLLAATVLATALGGGATPASAAIRIVINSGSTNQTFYSSDDATAYFTTTLGTYDLVVGSALTNLATQTASGGSLQQTLNVSDTVPGGPLPTLTITTSVIDSVVGASNGQVTGATEAAVLAAGLAHFTLPAGTSLAVGSDIEASSNAAAGTIQNNTTVNGTLVASLAIPIDGVAPPEAQVNATVGNNPVVGYTLVSQIVLSGASAGIMGSIAASSTVTSPAAGPALTPEPGPLALWGLGLCGILSAALRRARLRMATA
jgi:hypothetical protein